MYNSKITGLGYYLPENVVTNDDLSKFMETTDEWIQERTGIKERRWIDPKSCLLYTSPSPRDRQKSRMPSSA